MIINNQEFNVNELHYTIRSAKIEDAEALSAIRLQLDGETENFDREQGEALIDTKGFCRSLRLTQKVQGICV